MATESLATPLSFNADRRGEPVAQVTGPRTPYDPAWMERLIDRLPGALTDIERGRRLQVPSDMRESLTQAAWQILSAKRLRGSGSEKATRSTSATILMFPSSRHMP